MALIKLGALVSEVRGSIGGAVYARNRYGAYTRARTKPVDPNTALQNTYRTRMSMALTAWKALAIGQRGLWNAYAGQHTFTNRIGEAFVPSGLNLFTRSFILLDVAGLAQVTLPQINMVLEDPDCTCAYVAETGFVHRSTTANWPAGATMLIWLTYDLSNAINFYKGPYTTFGALLVASYTDNETSIRDDAGLALDSKMFMKWRIVSALGQASTPRYGTGFKPPA